MNNEKIVIGVAGMPGAGKSVVRQVVREMDCSVVVMGDVVRLEAKKRKLRPTPENLGMIMLKLRKERGSAVVADRCLAKVQRSDKDVVVVDGIRSLDEVKAFRRRFPKFILMAIHSSPRTRFERLSRRRRSDDPRGWDTFLKRDLRELRVGLGNAIATADYLVVNEGTRKEFMRKIREVLRDMIAKWEK
jgi:dephospho-CoA kinase